MKVLITGISGALARLVTTQLVKEGHTVLGIDRRPWADAPKGVVTHRVDIRKRPAEDVFRQEKPDAVIHMATVTYTSARKEERYRINLGGTRSVWEHCATYGVKQAIFIGRHTVYGAAPDAPLYRTEEEPLLAGSTFPSLADLVAADLYAGNALWRMPELNTAVLRLVYTLGPSRRGTLANFINASRVPLVMGFDPLFQFMHEQDAARAIVSALENNLRGVFNVSGPQPIPLSVLSEATGSVPVHVPEMLYANVLGRFGFPRLPRESFNHVKYPVVVDNSMFLDSTGFQCEFDEIKTTEAFRWS